MKGKFNFLLLLLGLLVAPFYSSSQEQQQLAGYWQMIVDGKPGEGSLFYRFDFKNDSIVAVTKQAGNNNFTETKKWMLVNSNIVITGNPDDKITEVESGTFVLGDNEIHYANNGYTGVLKPHSIAFSWMHLILALLGLMLLNEVFRRNRYALWTFFVLLPLVLTFTVWVNQGVTYWFKWVKLYSVIFASIWFGLIRFTSIHKYSWVKLIAALFLAVNIAEAVTQDFSMGFLPNVMNGAAGVLNIITLFYGWKRIGPDNSKERDMVWPDMTTFWIIAYDIWNIVYVYLNFPGSTSIQFIVLTSATLPALFIKKGTWLQARAFTLATWFMYYFTFPRFTEQTELLVPRSYELMLVVAAISLIANVVYLYIFIGKVRRKS